MNILFIVFNKIGQGTYLRAFELARGLVKFNHSLTILASSKYNKQKKVRVISQNKIKIIEIPNLLPKAFQAGWDVTNLLSRLKTLNLINFDIVHGFESRPTVIYPALKAHHKGVPLFLDWADWFGSGGSSKKDLVKSSRYYCGHLRIIMKLIFEKKHMGQR